LTLDCTAAEADDEQQEGEKKRRGLGGP
jgi:hypothetical protein